MFKPCLLLLVTSLYLALVRADYTIDDSNYSTLKFSENPSGPVWGPFGSDTGEVLEIRLPNGTMQTVDATPCYDGTYTYAACSTSNNCAVQFSFTGSGITIYVLQAGPQGMSASLSIDSGTPTTATLGAPPAPQYYISRVTLFSVQNIPSGTHTAVMTVLDWNGGFSGMMLDYIDINQAAVATPSSLSPAPSTSTSPSPSPSPSPTENTTSTQSPSSTPPPTSTNPQTSSQQTSSTGTQTNAASASVASVASVISFQSSGATALPSSTYSGNGTTTTPTSSSPPTSKKTNVAAVVGGGVAGGVGLLALICLTLFCFRRRRLRHEQTLNETPHPLFSPEATFTNTDPASVNPFGSSAALSATQPSGTSRPLQSWPDSEVDSTPNFAARDQSNSSPITNISPTRIASSGNISATSSMPLLIGVAAGTIATSQDRDASTPTPLAQPAVRSGATTLPISYPNEKSWSPLGTLQRDQDATLDVPNTRPSNAAGALTDEQADFVNSLFNNNVPAPVVARVLERMLANPQGGIGANDPELRAHLDPSSLPAPLEMHTPAGGTQWVSTMSDIGDGETTTGTAPPSYDYVRAQ